jgi:hypothetical protein
MLKAEDWRIAYSAALSLTQLKAVASRPSLKFCRDHYWYPRVRYAADFALRRLAEVDATKADRDRLGPTVNAKNLESAFGTFDFHDGQLRPLDDLASIPGLTLPAKDAAMKDSLYFARRIRRLRSGTTCRGLPTSPSRRSRNSRKHDSPCMLGSPPCKRIIRHSIRPLCRVPPKQSRIGKTSDYSAHAYSQLPESPK